MSDLRIRREHGLGLAKARKTAWAWAEQVEREFGMNCEVHEGKTEDTVFFSRSGVDGKLLVSADHFDLQAKLGFLLGAFAGRIESEITARLDALLEGEGARSAKPAKARKASAAAAQAPEAAVGAAARGKR